VRGGPSIILKCTLSALHARQSARSVACCSGSSATTFQLMQTHVHLLLQKWRQQVWSATEEVMQRNAEAAERVGQNLGEWASNINRAFQGLPTLLLDKYTSASRTTKIILDAGVCL